MRKNSFVFMIICSLFVGNAAASVSDGNAVLDARDFSLMLCLTNNYNALDKHKVGSVNNDASALAQRYNHKDWDNIIRFVEDNTSDYHNETVVMHSDEKGDKVMSIVFFKCMEFYHSKKLNKFIRDNKY